MLKLDIHSQATTFRKLRKIVILSLLFHSLFSSAQEFKTIGYLPTYRFSLIDQIDFEKITHINIAFANPDINGKLKTDGVNIDKAVRKAHEYGIEVFISLAGGAASPDDWHPWITPANRSYLIQNIIDYTIENNLQGIDVDLEWSSVNDDYSGFVLELRDSVDKYNLKLTAALPGTYRYPEISDKALQVYDWINLMVYDLTGPWDPDNPGPHSPYSFAENSIEYWLNQGVESERLTLGVPFYGWDFTDRNKIRAFKYSDMVATDPSYAQLDKVGQRYYNGLPTIEKKTILALEELSGIMIWELGVDDFGEYSLLDRINQTIISFQSTGIESMEHKLVNIYPNPSLEYINIESKDLPGSKISLISPNGKILRNVNVINQVRIIFSLDDYSAGVYYLMINSKSSSNTYKIVKL